MISHTIRAVFIGLLLAMIPGLALGQVCLSEEQTLATFSDDGLCYLRWTNPDSCSNSDWFEVYRMREPVDLTEGGRRDDPELLERLRTRIRVVPSINSPRMEVEDPAKDLAFLGRVDPGPFPESDRSVVCSENQIWLVRYKSQFSGQRATTEDVALEFFSGSRLLKRLSTLDIAGSPGNVRTPRPEQYQVFASMRRVVGEAASDGGYRPPQFEVTTVDGRIIRFDRTTGEVVSTTGGGVDPNEALELKPELTTTPGYTPVSVDGRCYMVYHRGEHPRTDIYRASASFLREAAKDTPEGSQSLILRKYNRMLASRGPASEDRLELSLDWIAEQRSWKPTHIACGKDTVWVVRMFETGRGQPEDATDADVFVDFYEKSRLIRRVYTSEILAHPNSKAVRERGRGVPRLLSMLWVPFARQSGEEPPIYHVMGRPDLYAWFDAATGRLLALGDHSMSMAFGHACRTGISRACLKAAQSDVRGLNR